MNDKRESSLSNLVLLDLNDIITGLNGTMNRAVEEKSITIETRLAKIGLIKADKQMLEEVILNLVINARDAITDGEGHIFIETSNAALPDGIELPDPSCLHPFLTFEYLESVWKHGRVLLTVSDTGCGMTKEVISKMYEPFFTTKKGEHVGLGLSITHSIVRSLGGYITVMSEVDKGTKFEIYLPSI